MSTEIGKDERDGCCYESESISWPSASSTDIRRILRRLSEYSQPVTASHCRSRSTSTARIPTGRGSSLEVLGEPVSGAASGRWMRSCRDGRALARYTHSSPPASTHFEHDGVAPSHFVRLTRHASHALAIRLPVDRSVLCSRTAGIEERAWGGRRMMKAASGGFPSRRLFSGVCLLYSRSITALSTTESRTLHAGDNGTADNLFYMDLIRKTDDNRCDCGSLYRRPWSGEVKEVSRTVCFNTCSGTRDSPCAGESA